MLVNFDCSLVSMRCVGDRCMSLRLLSNYFFFTNLVFRVPSDISARPLVYSYAG
jgi:hypothetical protein